MKTVKSNYVSRFEMNLKCYKFFFKVNIIEIYLVGVDKASNLKN